MRCPRLGPSHSGRLFARLAALLLTAAAAAYGLTPPSPGSAEPATKQAADRPAAPKWANPWAATAPAGRPVAEFSDTIEDLPADGGKPVAALGHQGCLVIRSAARWESVAKILTDSGWKPPADAVGPPDFTNHLVVLLFNNGDADDRYACHRYAGNAERAKLELVMSYVIRKLSALPPPTFNFILVTLPKSKNLEVTVGTYAPLPAGPRSTPDQARLEWKAAFDADHGDVADGLQAVIATANKTIKPGADISVSFQLQLVNPAATKDGFFVRSADSPFVWDGKYSNGYRNHAFLVTGPDGKTQLLQPKVIHNWDKNAPHLVRVTPTSPYALPGWTGDGAKSLKDLGLDTSKPGRYTITGIYSESGGQGQYEGQPAAIWGGNIASNEVTVEVKD